ncbi:D-alanyl-D-alanine carboxypeptidase/D-alanyl-D-alanine-endopeptidase (penicillin-binding protein 4) [Nocardiopsis mwathae]|uniref:D-alanyl-D-alanine carboxypeptidase/D-alanyl-D-alanine-endopeptidase (Penicillin-binding protein 4) n=1 Tax=Nocardiopsis mwathae TaxID=1472723 RepID=A0A7W9YIX3_9ACTN|nr:D-alanyl-D-alanine carboxypeptidase/D-alanyl-D-alanine-endopeptidase [Nocardiopsis mwathae]MBB6172978.1 D-alanyl-D-alanine carboxypeptidase/D-alanyl-D-alanine-endopeptidase (penicillin-binding protein 4) [Nocardiopsis mwathae]
MPVRRVIPHARTLLFTIATSAALVVSTTVPATADTASDGRDALADLRRDIDAILDDPALAGAVSGVLVRSLSEGDTLYGRDAATRLIPASNMKLVTAAAAMDVLGPEYTFRTTVWAGEDPSDGTVDGDLYIEGTGDPGLTVDAFAELAAEVADSGVAEVTGDLLADDTWFDDTRLHPDWERGDEPFYYAAQISALTVAANQDLDTGVVNVTAVPGPRVGAPADVALEPMTDNLSLDNRAGTGRPGGQRTVDVRRPSGSNVFTATGSLPLGGAPYSTLRTVHEPTDHAAHVFADALADAGVKVHGTVGRGTVPGGADEVAVRHSAELSDLLIPFMKLSNNGHGEILIKAMGAETRGEGTWQAGLTQVKPALDRIGADVTALRQADGSGLSRGNLIRAEGVLSLLDAVRDEPWADAWLRSLPVAGDSDRMVGGTLRNRMAGTPAEGNVRAKTGTLTGVSALSGYATAADGEELAFAIINNGHRGPAPRGVQDAIAVRLAEFSRTAPTSGDTPADYRGGSVAPAPDAQRHGRGDLECTWAEAC